MMSLMMGSNSNIRWMMVMMMICIVVTCVSRWIMKFWHFVECTTKFRQCMLSNEWKIASHKLCGWVDIESKFRSYSSRDRIYLNTISPRIECAEGAEAKVVYVKLYVLKSCKNL